MATQRASISTHVLDTERGEPAAGVPVGLARWEGERLVRLAEAETDGDGRVRDLLGDTELAAGGYQLVFDVGAYFRELDGYVPFLARVTIDFEVLDEGRHYHVPLLISRYSCSAYRGS
ncbi:MAG TPA: hydroxyisourate hydrolase [Roseiflexaceae bacterium]|nr:hydroxyisourate hydrolase [Roseiflexaceae bacterium]